MITFDEISLETCIPPNELVNLSFRAHKHYRTIIIPKRSGETRILHAPSFKIKGIQTWILRKLLDPIQTRNCVTGFVRRKSIKTNASIHAGNKYLLQMDIKDFFPSLKFHHVEEIFSRFTNDPALCKTLTRLCCFRNFLPQGGVTSPALSNIYLDDFDKRIEEKCGSHGYLYSRYADDITISGRNQIHFDQLKLDITSDLNTLDLQVNEKKTRIISGKGAMKITGLNINTGKPTVPKKIKRKLRADIYNLIKNKQDFPPRIEGSIAYISGIEIDYFSKIKAYIQKLAKKHPGFLEALPATKSDAGKTMPVSAKS